MNDKLKDFENRFKQASKKELTKLMNEMELEFKIPAINDDVFNKNNPEAMELYRKISNARWD